VGERALVGHIHAHRAELVLTPEPTRRGKIRRGGKRRYELATNLVQAHRLDAVLCVREGAAAAKDEGPSRHVEPNDLGGAHGDAERSTRRATTRPPSAATTRIGPHAILRRDLA